MEMNPDNAVLTQMREHWQKMFVLLLWKLSPDKRVFITHQDMHDYNAEFDSGRRILMTHGHKDSLEFGFVTVEEAEVLAAHDEATGRGNA